MRKYLYKPFVVMLSSVLLWTGWTGSGHAQAPEEAASVQWSHVLESNDATFTSAGGRAVTITSDGGYVFAGYQGSSLSEEVSSYVVKVNGNGEIVWKKDIDVLDQNGAYATNRAFAVTETSDGSILIAGEQIREDIDRRSRTVPFVFKLSPDGELLWEKNYPDISFYSQPANLIQKTSDGGAIIGGEARTDNWYPTKTFLLKINADGDLAWYEPYSFGFYTYFHNMVVTPDDGVIVTGEKVSSRWGPYSHYFIAKFGPTGDLGWQKMRETDEIRAVVPSGDGTFLLTRYNSEEERYYLQKMTETGDILWDKASDALSASAIGEIVQTQPMEGGFAVISKQSAEHAGKSYKYQVTLTDENAVPIQKYLFGSPELKILRGGISLDDRGLVYTGTLQTKTETGYKTTIPLAKIAVPGPSPSNPKFSKLQFQTDKFHLPVGQSVSSVVEAVYSDATVTDVTYSSSYNSQDPGIAKVDPLGNITGISPGTTVITATYKGLQASVTVEVTEGQTGPGRFFLDSNEYSLSVGTELDIAAFYTDETGLTSKVTQDTVFAMDDPAVAAVDEYGNIRGISPGVTQITAAFNGHIYRASVWVVRPYTPDH